jgi:hypothetical protein
VLEAFIAEEHAVQGTLEAAPPTLSAATTGLSNGNRLLASLTRLSVEVERTLPPAPAALRSTAALLRESHAPLGQARSLLEQARPAIPALLRITGAASPVLGPLRRGLATAAPMLDQVGRYGCDIKNFGAVFRSMTGFGGVGDGPNGAPGEFRVQVGLAGFGQTLGVGAADDPTAVRDTYAPPCRYPDTVYGLRSR